MRQGRSTRIALVAVALASLATMTACGGSDMTPTPSESAAAEPNGVEELSADEIVARMTDAVDAATSVHVTGDSAQGGSTLAIDLQLGSNGDAAGSLTSNGQEIQIAAVAGTVYFTADEAFWTAQGGAAAAAQLAGKYVEVPAGDQSFGSLTDYAAFMEQLLTPEGAVEKGDQVDVDGVAAIELIDTKDDGSLLVSLEGEPLPLKVVPTDGGELLLTDWNADFTVTAPAASDIVDPNTLAPATPSPSTPTPSP